MKAQQTLFLQGMSCLCETRQAQQCDTLFLLEGMRERCFWLDLCCCCCCSRSQCFLLYRIKCYTKCELVRECECVYVCVCVCACGRISRTISMGPTNNRADPKRTYTAPPVGPSVVLLLRFCCFLKFIRLFNEL